jgi:NTE family protein
MPAPPKIPIRVLAAGIVLIALTPTFASAAEPALPVPVARASVSRSRAAARRHPPPRSPRSPREMRIPISCVTGTSMGAIVGATFAAGRPPKEMEEIVLNADWDEIFRDKPPRGDRGQAQAGRLQDAVRARVRRQGRRTVVAEGRHRRRIDRVVLPQSCDAGFGITDFNKLPIPFRAMATDIETGQSVVLDHGSLAQAMRASMSVREHRADRDRPETLVDEASPTTCRSTRRASCAPTW